MSIKIVRWRCHQDGCSRSAQGVGSAWALRVIGWSVEVDESQDKPVLRCPEHHPSGARFAKTDADRLRKIVTLGSVVGEINHAAREIGGLISGRNE
jgi:hypothetical protein